MYKRTGIHEDRGVTETAEDVGIVRQRDDADGYTRKKTTVGVEMVKG
jgi:hypothetical protein